jgi:hypothetical protein
MIVNRAIWYRYQLEAEARMVATRSEASQGSEGRSA